MAINALSLPQLSTQLYVNVFKGILQALRLYKTQINKNCQINDHKSVINKNYAIDKINQQCKLEKNQQNPTQPEKKKKH